MMSWRKYGLAAVLGLIAVTSAFAQRNRGQVAPPSWAVGTWYGTTSYGPDIVITISGDGTVTSQIEGNTAYGRYRRGDVADFESVRVNVRRSGNGIETYNEASGERVVYSRRRRGGGGNGGGYGGGYGGGNDADGLGGRGVIVYEERNSRGRSQSFGQGRYLSGGGTFGNLGNDRASSVVVAGGFSVRLCESEGDGSGSGQCETWGPGTYNLRYNDKASFIEVFRLRR